ncbi:response regulator transcription factor [Amycolatopsis anabasis]|uniref:response regulator transcription factor n=1 Tax=Amycolatopsis anabasis TaxID=1840409 RepID=UPI001FEB3C83|nr:response regulator transcription factor [Amycolatopsis anabasis]
MNPVRVLLVEDHDMVAEALRLAFDEVRDIKLLACARSIAEALAATGTHRPDVILLDRRLPDGDGIAAIGRLRAVSPGSRVLVFTGDASSAIVARVIEAGGAGLLLKSGMFEDLVQAIRVVAAGHMTFESSLLAGGDEQPARRGETDPLFTTREREVLGLIAGGADTDRIAEELQLARPIVRHYLQRIFAKLGAHSDTEAVALARGRGLID